MEGVWKCKREEVIEERPCSGGRVGVKSTAGGVVLAGIKHFCLLGGS